MRLQDAFFALVAATAAAAPAPQLEEKIKSYLIPRDGVPQTVDIPTMDVNWTRFDDKPVETMAPAEADGSDTVKRGRRNKVDLKNSTTLTWKSGRLPPPRHTAKPMLTETTCRSRHRQAAGGL
jgi:hypothetical protein